MEMNLVRTRFESLDESGKVYSVTYGIRLYDDLDCAYVNTITSLDELLGMDADDLVEFARSGSETADEMLYSIKGEDPVRFYVDGEIYGGV
ncbi:hypothetical protein IB276_05870 [Ensifer sp. ENS04]|uniref:hypothetical protein n=1 Tax=Ensifer sp. ENS04 TaxID=2769281 RepID=UPI0017841909|nr:hypothetical protein [Ensifer sp. ENS04]MBD9538967.1 hypothetical protein [Ensifer sp. ENS04]